MSAETIAVIYCVALTVVLAAPLAILAGWCPLCVTDAEPPIPVYNGTQTHGPIILKEAGQPDRRCGLIIMTKTGATFAECTELKLP